MQVTVKKIYIDIQRLPTIPYTHKDHHHHTHTKNKQITKTTHKKINKHTNTQTNINKHTNTHKKNTKPEIPEKHFENTDGKYGISRFPYLGE